MARGINKVILVGNLGNDPDVRYTASGSSVANVSLATTDSWKDKESGEMQDRTEWHRIVFFGRLAEIVAQYLKKGAQIYVEGRLQTRKWQDRDGNDRYTTEIVANEMQMLGGRNSNMGEFNQAAPAAAAAPMAAAAATDDMPPAGASSADDDFIDDDIPF